MRTIPALTRVSAPAHSAVKNAQARQPTSHLRQRRRTRAAVSQQATGLASAAPRRSACCRT
ncbi:hypothetical protein CGCFRS4_v016126 [Colletotrichum fructicola]|nr:hypothetical protein CGCFRS4_v016126 [Colletotrichum fructicola]